MLSKISLLVFNKLTSVGYFMLPGATVASKIKFPNFSGSSNIFFVSISVFSFFSGVFNDFFSLVFF